MPTLKQAIIGAAVVAGVTCVLLQLTQWWHAYFSGAWTSCVVFNRYGEHWAEGVMFHGFAAAVGLAVGRYFDKPS